MWDRCHLNVTTIIKSQSSQEQIRLVVLRSDQSLDRVSVKPLEHYPLLLDDMVICSYIPWSNVVYLVCILNSHSLSSS